MRAILAVGAAAGLLIFLALGQSGGEAGAAPVVPPEEPVLEWAQWRASPAGASGTAAPETLVGRDPVELPETDVVDAYWMALTMWGEARGQGEEAMRAVGHVIDNRRRAGRHGDFVTDTVSAAFQFSCWNPGDPNREAMLNVDLLLPDSRDHAMWAAARDLAEEILAGRSLDPTGGALFYHAAGVAPAWSRGVAPVARIGDHLFFRTARRG